jgi:hypothetical protein
MNRFFIAILLLVISLSGNTQQLAQVTFGDGENFSYFSFITSENVLIRVSQDGNVQEWGIELQSMRNDNYFAPKLQPYLGRIEFYGPESDVAYKGKLKSIGTCFLTYYDHYENDTRSGKLKSVGTVFIDYFDNVEKAELRGKIKSIGNRPLQYYSSIEDAGSRNKLKSIENTVITYHSSLEDKKIKGKIKSIGSQNFAWFSTFDLNRYGLKSGLYRTNINGITYILRK